MEITQKEINLVKHLAFKLKQRYYSSVDVEELIGAGLEGLTRSLVSFDPNKGAFSTYSTIRIKGSIIDYIENYNKKNIVKDAATQDYVSVDDKIEDKIDRAERLTILLRIINGFDYRDRKILKLYYLEGKTFEEIGNTLKISKSRITRLHDHALTKLTKCVASRVY